MDPGNTGIQASDKPASWLSLGTQFVGLVVIVISRDNDAGIGMSRAYRESDGLEIAGIEGDDYRQIRRLMDRGPGCVAFDDNDRLTARRAHSVHSSRQPRTAREEFSAFGVDALRADEPAVNVMDWKKQVSLGTPFLWFFSPGGDL